jgi:cation transport ATPase
MPEDFKAESGLGIQCIVQDPVSFESRHVAVGNSKWMLQLEPVAPVAAKSSAHGSSLLPSPATADGASNRVQAVSQDVARMQHEGKSVVYVAVDGLVVAVIGIADQIRPEAALTVAILKQMNIGVKMITGDNKLTAAAIAAQVRACAVLLLRQFSRCAAARCMTGGYSQPGRACRSSSRKQGCNC